MGELDLRGGFGRDSVRVEHVWPQVNPQSKQEVENILHVSSSTESNAVSSRASEISDVAGERASSSSSVSGSSGGDVRNKAMESLTNASKKKKPEMQPRVHISGSSKGLYEATGRIYKNIKSEVKASSNSVKEEEHVDAQDRYEKITPKNSADGYKEISKSKNSNDSEEMAPNTKSDHNEKMVRQESSDEYDTKTRERGSYQPLSRSDHQVYNKLMPTSQDKSLLDNSYEGVKSDNYEALLEDEHDSMIPDDKAGKFYVDKAVYDDMNEDEEHVDEQILEDEDDSELPGVKRGTSSVDKAMNDEGPERILTDYDPEISAANLEEHLYEEVDIEAWKESKPKSKILPPSASAHLSSDRQHHAPPPPSEV